MADLTQGLNSLAALRVLEQDFYEHFEFESFYRALLEYFLKHYGVEEYSPLTIPQMKKLNEFVGDWFEGKAAGIEPFIVKAFVIGRLSNIQETVTPLQLLKIQDLPEKIQQAAVKYNLTANQVRALQFAEREATKNIVNVSTDTAAQIQDMILESIKNKGYYGFLQRKLTEAFAADGTIEKDWRMIAVTELNSARNNGYISGVKSGKFVMGLSVPRCCDFCDEFINGKIYAVIEPKGDIDYDGLTPGTPEYIRRSWLWENTVWTGKSNFGRSRAKSKKIDPHKTHAKENLTARAHHEQWMPTVPAHPACRCTYLEINSNTQFIDKKGDLKLKFQDPKAWQEWYDRVIKPREMQIKKFGH